MMGFLRRLIFGRSRARMDRERAVRRAKVTQAVQVQHEARIQLSEALAELSAARAARSRGEDNFD